MAGAAWLLACIGMLPATHAQEIHKCAAAGGISYQSAPCGDGQAQVAVITPARAAVAAGNESSAAAATGAEASDATVNASYPAAIPARSAGRWNPSRLQAVAPGVSDDEVLNAPAWGVPNRVSRWREKRVWHEVWFYESHHGETRQLSFANGRLTDIAARVVATPTRLTVASN